MASTTTADHDDDPTPFAAEVRTPAVIIDSDAFAGNKLPATAGELKPRAQAPGTRTSQSVPVGEFDRDANTRQQTTARRDAAEALLQVPDDETPVEDLVDDDDDEQNDDGEHDDQNDDHDEDGADRDPHAAHDVHADYERRRSQADVSSGTHEAGTEKFERGDPTDIKAPAAPDATEIQTPRSRAHLTGGTLRRSAALRRKRGLYGDVRYVFTALFGVRRSRRELGELEQRQELRATSRRRHLITAGRAAATMESFDHPALGRARDTLSLIEEERSKHQGAVAASDAELDRVRRDRETNVKAHAEATLKADAELAELAKKLEPLEKEALAARKKAAELRDEVQRIDKKIGDTEALLVSVKGEKLDKAGVHADIATFKANKQAVLRDEPKIAAELDQLNPRLAALDATRSELQKKKLELDKADQDDQRRTLELLEAIGAKRKVVERASADAEAARDNALFELGERLYVDRPKQLTPELSPIDRIDLEIGEDERRAMEVREILSNIDKAKFARGMAMIILAVGAAGTLVWLIYTASG